MVEYWTGKDVWRARIALQERALQEHASLHWLEREDLEKDSLRTRMERGGGLFGKEMYIVRDPSQLPSSIQEDFIEASTVSSPVVCVLWDRVTPPKKAKVAAAFKQSTRMFAYPAEDVLIGEIRQAAQERGLEVDAPVARELLARLAWDRSRVMMELDKLCVIADKVTLDLLNIHVPAGIGEGEVFAMLDALVNGRRAEALSQLEALLTAGEHELRILSLLAYQFRSLVQVARNIPDGLHPYVVQKHQRVVRRKPPRYWSEALMRVMATDFAIKQGKVDARTGLTMLVMGLAQ